MMTVGPGPGSTIAGATANAPQLSDGCKMPVPSRHLGDVSLLFRCMELLGIARTDLAKDDPLLFFELQGLCSLCLSKEECSEDLAGEFVSARRNKWQEYCPNSTTLVAISGSV